VRGRGVFLSLLTSLYSFLAFQAARGGGTWLGGVPFDGAISSSVAASAHIPKPRPIAPHTMAERPRRLAITAVSGASAALITAEVTSRLREVSLKPIRPKPDAKPKALAQVSIANTRSAYITRRWPERRPAGCAEHAAIANSGPRV
jgi:hypothetical protein